jgi:hypothetical protein
MRLTRLLVFSSMALAFALLVPAFARAQRAPKWSWYDADGEGNVQVHLYLFWSDRCPHCPKAIDFTKDLKKRYPWLRVHRHEISSSTQNRDLYRRMAASLDRQGGQVPAFFFCKRLETGYNSYASHGKRIETSLVRWKAALEEHARKKKVAVSRGGVPPMMSGLFLVFARAGNPQAPDDAGPDVEAAPDLPIDLPEEEKVAVPLWGDVTPAELSLPAFTVVLAGCDAFNPCAFFVLLFLLSLLIHGRSRTRMLLVGGTFVFFSGLVYFLFMAAWLNLFFLIGHLRIVTLLAGLVALVIALLNVKDYFWFKKGPSLSIPESVKPGLYQRMTRLINVESMALLLGSTVALAALVNLYELLCTAGFPLVYTRVLTLRQLPTASYYLYLTLYNLIYVAPLALIVLVFTLTLGRHKLTEYQGRVLKLLSGLMMLALGGLLLAAPEMLNTITGAVATLVGAGLVTGLIVLVDLVRRRTAASTQRHGLREPA